MLDRSTREDLKTLVCEKCDTHRSVYVSVADAAVWCCNQRMLPYNLTTGSESEKPWNIKEKSAPPGAAEEAARMSREYDERHGITGD
jgi:hypothetical protein